MQFLTFPDGRLVGEAIYTPFGYMFFWRMYPLQFAHHIFSADLERCFIDSHAFVYSLQAFEDVVRSSTGEQYDRSIVK